MVGAGALLALERARPGAPGIGLAQPRILGGPQQAPPPPRAADRLESLRARTARGETCGRQSGACQRKLSPVQRDHGRRSSLRDVTKMWGLPFINGSHFVVRG